MGLNLKKIKAFKVIISALLVITFTVSVISCKEVLVVEGQEEKPAGEVSSETAEEENKETESKQ